MPGANTPLFLLGVGVGAALGILYAPRPGEEIREDLRVRANEGRDYVRRRSGALRDQAGTVLDRSRSAVGVQKDQLASALEAGRKAYREATGRDPSMTETGST